MADVGAMLVEISLTVGVAASRPAVNMQDLHCPPSLAYNAAEHIKATVPGYRDTLEGQKGALVTLHAHIQDLFDPEHTGYMDADSFTDLQWAAILITLPPRQCTLSFDDYVHLKLGPKAVADPFMKAEPFMRETLYHSFKAMDRGHKGYLDRSDWRGIFLSSFRAADRDRDGRVTMAQYLNH